MARDRHRSLRTVHCSVGWVGRVLWPGEVWVPRWLHGVAEGMEDLNVFVLAALALDTLGLLGGSGPTEHT